MNLSPPIIPNSVDRGTAFDVARKGIAQRGAGFQAVRAAARIVRETPMGDYDRSSKWLIKHHGDALLRLAGVTGFARWSSVQSEVVQPAQLPDGCLEVQMAEGEAPDYFVMELATYAENRVTDQLVRDTLLVRLDRRQMPEVIVFVLRPKGQVQVPDHYEESSRLGLSELGIRWKVVELWKVPAEALLETRDPGLVPWATLAQYEGAPDTLLRRCREIIDAEGLPQEHTNLLAITQVLARLRYNSLDLFAILGGRRVMIESPLIQEIVAEVKAKALLMVLHARFSPVPPDLEALLTGITDEKVLDSLIEHASRCRGLSSFRTRIPS